MERRNWDTLLFDIEIIGDEHFLINSSIVLFGIVHAGEFTFCAVESLRETFTAGVLCHLTCDTINGEGDLTIVRSIAFSSGVHKVPDREVLTSGIPCSIPACDRLDGEWHFTKVISIALSGGVEKVPEGVTLKAGVLSSCNGSNEEGG